MGESYPTLWVAHLTNVDEHGVRMECYIPKAIKIRFDEEGKGTVVCSNCHESTCMRPCFGPVFNSLSFL